MTDEYCEGRIFQEGFQLIHDWGVDHIAGFWSDDNRISYVECRCGWTYTSGDAVDTHKAWSSHVTTPPTPE